MPAAAPATSSVVRSASVSLIHCAMSEPRAPPLIMMGPSAPNGPPEPMAIAAEIGFRMATLGVDSGAIQQDGFNCLGDTVTPNLVGAVASHAANQQAANDRNNHHPMTKRTAGRRDGDGAEPVIVEKVRRDGDQLKQHHGEKAWRRCR